VAAPSKSGMTAVSRTPWWTDKWMSRASIVISLRVHKGQSRVASWSWYLSLWNERKFVWQIVPKGNGEDTGLDRSQKLKVGVFCEF
jgi:hypothetical protein